MEGKWPVDFNGLVIQWVRARLPEKPHSFRLCIPKTPSGGFPSNVTLLLPGRLLDPGSSSLPACH